MSGRRRGKDEAYHGADERWVLSYADLVTLLLGLFIIMYSASELDLKKFEDISVGLARAFNVDVKEGLDGGTAIFEGGRGILPGPVNTNQLDTELDAIKKALEEGAAGRGLDGDFILLQDEDRIVIRLANSLVFPSASADLRAAAEPLLQVIGDVISALPNDIRVEGHTDNVPVGTDRFPSNWELSTARATAVVRFLTESASVDPTRIFAAGFGEFGPVASNSTPEGRAANRRADVVVLYPHSSETESPGDAEPFPLSTVGPLIDEPPIGDAPVSGEGNE